MRPLVPSSICFVAILLTWEQFQPPTVTLYRLRVNGTLVTAWVAAAVTPLATPNRYQRLVPIDVPDGADVRLLACNGADIAQCSDDSNAYPWPTPTRTPAPTDTPPATQTPVPTWTLPPATPTASRPTPARILNIERVP